MGLIDDSRIRRGYSFAKCFMQFVVIFGLCQQQILTVFAQAGMDIDGHDAFGCRKMLREPSLKQGRPRLQDFTAEEEACRIFILAFSYGLPNVR
jgi:hypothetical protein